MIKNNEWACWSVDLEFSPSIFFFNELLGFGFVDFFFLSPSPPPQPFFNLTRQGQEKASKAVQ